MHRLKRATLRTGADQPLDYEVSAANGGAWITPPPSPRTLVLCWVMTSRLLALAALLLALLAVAETAPIAAQSPPPCPTRSATPASDPRLTQDCNTLLELKATLEGTATLNWAQGYGPEFVAGRYRH